MYALAERSGGNHSVIVGARDEHKPDVITLTEKKQQTAGNNRQRLAEASLEHQVYTNCKQDF